MEAHSPVVLSRCLGLQMLEAAKCLQVRLSGGSSLLNQVAVVAATTLEVACSTHLHVIWLLPGSLECHLKKFLCKILMAGILKHTCYSFDGKETENLRGRDVREAQKCFLFVTAVDHVQRALVSIWELWARGRSKLERSLTSWVAACCSGNLYMKCACQDGQISHVLPWCNLQ